MVRQLFVPVPGQPSAAAYGGIFPRPRMRRRMRRRRRRLVPVAPPPPPMVPLEPVVRPPESVKWSMFVEGQYRARGSDPGRLASEQFRRIQTGKRVRIRDDETGESRLFLKAKRGYRAVPPPLEPQVESLPPASRERIVEALEVEKEPVKEKRGFPWWLIPAGLLIL